MIDPNAFVMTVGAVRRYARHYRTQEKKKEFNLYDTAGSYLIIPRSIERIFRLETLPPASYSRIKSIFMRGRQTGASESLVGMFDFI